MKLDRGRVASTRTVLKVYFIIFEKLQQSVRFRRTETKTFANLRGLKTEG